MFTNISVRITLNGIIVLPNIITICRSFYYVLQPGGCIFHFSKRRPFSEYSAIEDIIFIRQKNKDTYGVNYDRRMLGNIWYL